MNRGGLRGTKRSADNQQAQVTLPAKARKTAPASSPVSTLGVVPAEVPVEPVAEPPADRFYDYNPDKVRYNGTPYVSRYLGKAPESGPGKSDPGNPGPGESPLSPKIRHSIRVLPVSSSVPPDQAVISLDHDGKAWHPCPIAGCLYKAKEKGSIKKHQASVHDIGVNWLECPVAGCGYKAKTALNKHLKLAHDQGVKWHECGSAGCGFRTKQKINLEKHGMVVHNAGVKWFHCGHPVKLGEVGGVCAYKAKSKSDVTKHKANKHDVCVKWKLCEVAGCNFKAKSASNLKTHIKSRHEGGLDLLLAAIA